MVFIAPQMIQTASVLGLSSFWTFLQRWFVGNSWAFITTIFTLPTEAKQNYHLACDFGLQFEMTSDGDGWDLCTIQLCEMWNCPIGELQSVLLCILLKNVNWTGGRGSRYVLPVFRTQMAQTCLWLSEGEGAAELPVNKDWWNLRSSGEGLAWHQGRQPINHCGTCLAYCTLNFQLGIFLVIWLSAYNTSSKSWESYILGIGCHVD